MKQFLTCLVIALLGCALLDVNSASSQQPLTSASAIQSRTRAIVTSFNKSKHEVKEKYGVRMEKYKNVRSEAVVKLNPEDYSGTYEVRGMGFSLQLRADRNGNAEGAGYEPAATDAGVRRRFTLRNAKIDGALLTSRKVYAGGESEPFEGVFINRTSFDSPTDRRGFTAFGLGVVGPSVEVSGVTLDRYFYELKR